MVEASRTGGARTRWQRLTALVALLLTFSLIAAACGGDDDDEGSSGSDGGGEAGGGESEDEGGGVSGEPIKIGVTISLSGPAGTIGETQLAGIEMAVDELNEGDGILGRPVDLVVKDDASDPTKAAQNMRELVDQEEVKLVFGPTLSSPALAATPIASDAGVIQFSSSVAPELGDPSQYPYFFRVSPAAALQAVTFVEYIEASGWSKVGLLAVNNALGSSNVEAFKGAIAGTDIEIVSTETHESGAVDLTTQVSSLERSGAEVVLVLNTATSDQIAAVKARNGIEWDVPMLGFSSMSNPAVAAGVGGSMEGVYSGQQVRNLTVGNVPEQGERFLEGIREKLGQDPLTEDVSQAAVGYDAIMMMAAAVNEVGDLDDPDAIAAAIEDGSPWDGAVKAAFVYDGEQHDGETLEDLVFVLADSFDDGLYEIAPNQ